VGWQQRFFGINYRGRKMKIDFIDVRSNVMIWKQIEKRDGLTFMRIKKSRKGVLLK